MRLSVTTAAVVASLLLWTATFYTAQKTYHAGQEHGVIPNLHLKHLIGLNG